jgi:nucleotide-binding universal stress UspA family protein
MYKKMVVPVDGSETSWRALRQAVELGVKFAGSEIIVLTVIQPYNNAALLAVPLDHNVISQSNADMERIGNEVLKQAREIVGPNYPGKVSFEMEVGHPSERILAVTKESGADAIIIGSRGLSGIAEFFLGSVSSKISQYANVPVLIVK